MESRHCQNMAPVVPIRLGTVMRLIREGQFNLSLRAISQEILSTILDGGAELISSSTWSNYELGMRLPREGAVYNLIPIISDMISTTKPGENFKPSQRSPIDPELSSQLLSLYYREQVITRLVDVFPLRYAGAAVLAYFLADKDTVTLQPPYPDEYYINEASTKWHELSWKILSDWLNGDQFDFRRDFGLWLVFGNRFICKRFAGPSCSIGTAQKLFDKFGRDYVNYTNSLRFCAEAYSEPLLFEYTGPAIDSILSLSESLQLSPTLDELTIKVIGREEPIKITAFWSEHVSRMRGVWGRKEKE